MAKLRLILGDQLNEQHSWYTTPESDCIYLMAEMLQETNYVKHHIQKVVAFSFRCVVFLKDYNPMDIM